MGRDQPSVRTLWIDPITPKAFADYGQVLGGGSAQAGVSINAGTTLKLAAADLALTAHGGEPGLFIYRTVAQALPLSLTLLECHQFGSQTFMPLANLSFVVVVAKSSVGADTSEDKKTNKNTNNNTNNNVNSSANNATPDLSSLRAFWVDGHQGVSLSAGTWHHPLISLHDGELVVLERVASTADCLIQPLATPIHLQARAL